MLTLIAALLFPPVDVIEQPAAEPVAYEFAFAAAPGESRADMQDRLRTEAMDYCRDALREAGVRGEASACARQVTAQVTERMDDAAYAVFAAN